MIAQPTSRAPMGSNDPTSNAGAHPNDIRSAMESNCTPNSLDASRARANAPSSESINTATRIINAASSG